MAIILLSSLAHNLCVVPQITDETLHNHPRVQREGKLDQLSYIRSTDFPRETFYPQGTVLPAELLEVIISKSTQSWNAIDGSH